jgi:hypothetical protein
MTSRLGLAPNAFLPTGMFEPADAPMSRRATALFAGWWRA